MVRNEMKYLNRLVLVFFFAISINCKGEDVPIKGWIILSNISVPLKSGEVKTLLYEKKYH